MDYKTFNLIADTLDSLSFVALKGAKRPSVIIGQPVPKTLNALSYGSLMDLKTIIKMPTLHKMLTTSLSVVFPEVDVNRVEDEDVMVVYGFCNWIGQELARIMKAFNDIQTKPSHEELEAGVRDLDFGDIGILDWYAKRQHLPSFRESMSVKWIDIWQCMKMDNQVNEYKRRLQDVYNKKHK